MPVTPKPAPQHEPQSESSQNSLAKHQHPEAQSIQRATVKHDVLQRLIVDPHTASPEAIQLVRESYGQSYVQRLLESHNQPDNQSAHNTTVSNAPTGDLNSFLGQISANRAKLTIQPKLTVTPAGDQYEQEADAVAAQVVQQINAPTPVPAVQRDHENDKDKLQMMRDAGFVQRQPEEDKDKLQMMRLQRQTGDVMGGMDVDAGIESRIQSARGSGSPIAEGSRTKLESAFGADFSGVRVHTDSESDTLNRSVQARAFTTGQDIFFRQGEYSPGSSDGQKLLAHELTHVVQQNGKLGRSRLSKKAIQRKIGFELELNNWQTWKARWWSSLNAAIAIPAHGPDPVNRWTRLPKGTPLIRGNGFELQAEDDPNNAQRSVLEIVTNPFDNNSIAGRGEVRNAMRSAQAIINNMAGGYVPALNNHTYLAANMVQGGNVVESRSFFKTMNPANNNAKVQTTFGVRLDQLGTMMQDLFLDPNENAGQAAARQPGRQQVGGWNPAAGAPPAGSKVPIWGEAPSQALQGINAYRAVAAAAPASTPQMVSLLALLYAYLRTGDMGVRSYPKTIGWIMARTDFASMYRLLSAGEQIYYRGNAGVPFLALVSSIPNLAAMNMGGPVFGAGITVGGAVDITFNALTRNDWIQNIPRGRDLLTARHFPTRAKREDIEGLGAYGNKTDRVTTGAGAGAVNHAAPIFELRTIPNVAAAQWDTFADRIWLYSYFLNQGHTTNADKFAQPNLPF